MGTRRGAARPTAVPVTGADLREAPLVSWTVRSDHVAVITVDDPSAAVNTLGPQLVDELADAVRALRADREVLAIVVRSGKADSFMVGLDPAVLRRLRIAREASGLAEHLSTRLGELGVGKPVVVAVHGAAQGGGFALALAAHAIVASDDPSTLFGLPEVTLGLLPVGRSMARVAERAGLACALELALGGASLRPDAAKRLGLVHEVCPAPRLFEAALALARRFARRKNYPKTPTSQPLSTTLRRALLEGNRLGAWVLCARARAALAAATPSAVRAHTDHPRAARDRILGVLEAYGRGMGTGAAAEHEAFGALVVSEASRQLVALASATATLQAAASAAGPDAPPAQVGIVGVGAIGAGVAALTVRAGLDVRLRDRDAAGLGRGLRRVRELLEADALRADPPSARAEHVIDRVSGAAEPAGLRDADLVLEAAPEDLALKRRLVAELEAELAPGCVIASCTSSLSIASIAEVAARPEQLVGMHYLRPAHRNPLLEIVPGARTSARTLATAVGLGRRQGKTVLVLKDTVGFYAARTLAPYLNEAGYLVAEGVAIDAIDAALVEWGFAVGPLALLDQLGLELAARVRANLVAAYGERMRPPAGLERLVAAGRAGRSAGKGFYVYGKKNREKYVDPAIYAILGVTPTKRLAGEELQMRCALALVNEAARCLEEGVLRAPGDGDVGAVSGLGFPAFRGGPFRYVDAVGAREIVKRLRGYEARFGERFKPAALLREHAETGATFYAD